jgi:pantoate--beta-alanine ligase
VERVASKAEARRAAADARTEGKTIALVPTMGALHEGHLSLVRAACGRADYVVVSVFVNPTQFGPGEDFDAYPRDLEADERRLRALGPAAPDVVYAPEVAEMYPDRAPDSPAIVATSVSVAGLTERLCGAARPGHFDGVCTVVSKLFNQVRPDVAFFGRKDFQQLQIIRRMARDLDMEVEIVGVPTVRESDGVAMSSRNAYLSDDERRAARALSRGLAAAVRAARRAREDNRTVTPEVLREEAAGRIMDDPHVRIDYVDVVDPETLQPPDHVRSQSRGDGEGEKLLVAVAGHVGAARLIDNVLVGDVADEQRLLDATDQVAG